MSESHSDCLLGEEDPSCGWVVGCSCRLCSCRSGKVLGDELAARSVDRSAEDRQRTVVHWAWMLLGSVVGDSWLVLKQSWQEVGRASRQRLR